MASRLKEQRVWDAMRNAGANLYGRDVYMTRLENAVSTGEPDVTVLITPGLVTRVELKAVWSLPRRASSKVLGAKGLRRDQLNFHLEWTAREGRSVVLVGVGDTRRYYVAIKGKHADRVNDATWTELLSMAFAAGLQDVFWPRFFTAIAKEYWGED